MKPHGGEIMKILILIGLICTSTYASATSDIYAYNFWGHDILTKYFAEIEASPAAHYNAEKLNPKCLPVFKNALKNGQLDIRYAFGYFDDSQGIDIVWDHTNYGISPSLDIGMFHSLHEFLTEPCSESSTRTSCGFKSSGDLTQGKVILEKEIKLFNTQVTARISMTQASASESFTTNTTSLHDRQKLLTLQSEENYFGGIGTADVVIYNGHSRNGGGPDFNPPRLASDLHPNYNGYYKVQRPGIKRVVESIKKGGNKDSVLGFFSCSSKAHFYDMIMNANSKQRVVFSSDIIDYYDSLKASSGYLEGLLRGYCSQELADLAKQGEKLQVGFQGFQIR